MEYRVNRQIKAKEVRLVDQEGKQIGIVPIQEALRIAEEMGLDLVEVAPNANPPVCKLLDYGKFLYEMKKKEKEAKKKQREHSMDVKDINLSLRIDEHDLKVKLKQMREFLEDGDKVRVRIRFRGRENVHPELGDRLVNRIVESLSDCGQLEGEPKKEGNFLIFSLLPKRK
ncbi:translation initiation factor IF-3 [Thermocrinis jamiesonii]|uniref:translation initiation factor IF-3 n=1 Tax=Thermocrinis jamiesonii TaxID=1302351 RepID=UPI00049620AE|nr:translation initiation factor IF-3 [Thermocrinis jamiesonii]